ncbi:hypothetical protein GCM10009839_49580 [Catenulispora yoronensis]|uniref:Uncharacterized protein n=1 Tax=Catenulispora yoronensis TaxID=450799 RepID=A0ABN2UPZ5_9ACTN
MTDVKLALAYVCVHRDALRLELADVEPGRGLAADPASLLEVLDAALAAGDAVQPILDAIDATLREDGDALGLYGRLRADARGLSVAGIAKAPPAKDEAVLVCPAGLCSRAQWPVPGASGGAAATPGPRGLPSERCALTGAPLSEARL